MFNGSMPALVTPFKNGAVDFETLKHLVEWHIEQGSHGLVPVGTTGESPTLTHDEHEAVIETVVTTVAGRMPVIAGAGSNNTAEAMRFVQFAHKVGANGALVVTPYYNKPTQAGLIAHFKALHDCAEIPIVIYNIPGRSVVDMSPATMGELAKLPRIVGVKDATGDLAAGQSATPDLRHGFFADLRRRRHGAWVQCTGWSRVHLGHGQCRARALFGPAKRLSGWRFRHRTGNSGQTDAPASGDLCGTGPLWCQIRHEPSGSLR